MLKLLLKNKKILNAQIIIKECKAENDDLNKYLDNI